VTRIAVVGGGAWGTALADLLARKGAFESVTLWAREPEVVDGINREHLNPVFLPARPWTNACARAGIWGRPYAEPTWSCRPRRRMSCVR